MAVPAPAYAKHVASHTAETAYLNAQSNLNPYIVFQKGTITSSDLIAYVSFPDGRWRIKMRSGSGQNQDECKKYPDDGPGGWLPSGTYSSVQYNPNKTSGDPVVRGRVWYLGSKLCHNGTRERTGLFIHSQGKETDGWCGNNCYKSQGCIKISQLDRYDVSGPGPNLWGYLRGAYNRDNETLSVLS